MSVYYVTRPGLGLDALVHAPSTEKARTAFLDYLERTQVITRAQRSRARVNMVAERLEDPQEVEGVSLELEYGYGEPALPRQERIRLPEREEAPQVREDRFEYEEVPPAEEYVGEEYEEPEGMPEPEQLVRSLSPIEELSLKGGGI